MDRHGRHAWHLLCVPLDPLGPRPIPSRSGRAARPSGAPLLFLFPRDLAAGILLRHRPSGSGGAGAVPRHLGGRARVVRLHLSADGVDRSDDRRGALLAGRPEPASQAGQASVGGRDDLEEVGDPYQLAADRRRHGRRLGLLLRRRADPCRRAGDVRRADGGVSLHRAVHGEHLCPRRHRPRAGVHLYVSLAAHPGRDVRPGLAADFLPHLAGRTAWAA